MLRWLKKYNKNEVQNLLIIGAPKSGTTALLYKLKVALGGSDVAEYFEPAQLEQINKAVTKHQKSVTKVVAINAIDPQSVSNFSKIIVIPRDPRDQFISSMLYEAAFHALYDKDDALILEFYNKLCKKAERPQDINCTDLWGTYVSCSLPLDEFVKRNEYLRTFYRSSDAFVLTYEDFINNNVVKLEHYLGVSLHQATEVPNQFKRVIRTKGSGSWKDWLTYDDLRFFKENFSKYYHDFDYLNLDWDLRHHKIDKTFASEYFLKTLNEKRNESGFRPITP